MKRFVSSVCAFVFVVSVALVAQKPAGPVVLQQDKAFDFSKIKTYAWGGSHPAQDPAADKIITAAIEAQLAAKGLTKAAASDVEVAYHTVERADVDLSTFDDKEPAKGETRAPAKMVRIGTLAIDLRNPATRKVVWRVSVEGVLEKMAPAESEKFLNDKVASLFALYPGAKPVKK